MSPTPRATLKPTSGLIRIAVATKLGLIQILFRLQVGLAASELLGESSGSIARSD